VKIYIERSCGRFYHYPNWIFTKDVSKYLCLPDSEVFDPFLEIGSKVYFQEAKQWAEVCDCDHVPDDPCHFCVLDDLECNARLCTPSNRKDGKHVTFKKIETDIDNPDEIFYVLNTKTNHTLVQHTHESARDEAERLARAHPDHTFRVLKVVGECTGKVQIKWKGDSL
jgi:hypothetical protein